MQFDLAIHTEPLARVVVEVVGDTIEVCESGNVSIQANDDSCASWSGWPRDAYASYLNDLNVARRVWEKVAAMQCHDQEGNPLDQSLEDALENFKDMLLEDTPRALYGLLTAEGYEIGEAKS